LIQHDALVNADYRGIPGPRGASVSRPTPLS